ncbi:hypothetical protein MTR_3g463250 [Medicago truncatula]|uniref:Uncharacterized protein n=1 Tax=Medicago truncatula TaxID=3880 RepID=G7ZYI4_MEDTR|nr:hypothetical protein MTR_3g463250 [Medicago truncatula]
MISFRYRSFVFGVGPNDLLFIVDLLHRVQMIMHSNVKFPKSMNIVLTMIAFAIQKN